METSPKNEKKEPMSEDKIKIQTLVFLRNEDQILLGLKRRGFGEGKWNGYGGKLEEGESLKTCARRELLEESNLVVEEENLHYLGFIQVGTSEKIDRQVYIFTTNYFTGELMETEEMRPEWFGVKDIPYKGMWEDSYFWLPFVLRRKQFEAQFVYGEKNLTSIKIELKSI